MSLDCRLLAALSAIERYLPAVVIAGGWVPHVYAAQTELTERGGLLTTRDIDLAVPREVPQHDQSINDLLVKAGFKSEFRSLDKPPITKYVADANQPDETEIEFITPMRRNDETAISVQSDLTAQALRYLEILLEHPWPLSLDELSDGQLDAELRVPTPAAYVFHRALSYQKRRDRVKKEKDLYYAFYVVAAFPEWHAWMRGELPEHRARWPAWFRSAQSDMARQFSSIDSAGVEAVAHQRPATALSGLNDEQFRQYVLSTMQLWLEWAADADEGSGP